MTIREFINLDISVDVYDDVCDEIAVAFEGPQLLTETGMDHFAEVLNYRIELSDAALEAYVLLDEHDDWEDRLEKSKEFFYAAAGYCSETEYHRWFAD